MNLGLAYLVTAVSYIFFFRRGSSSWSVRSWDSHAHYQDYPDEEDGDEGGLGGGGNGNEDGQDNPEGGLYPSSIRPIVCYCDMSTFKTPRTILRVLLVVRRKLIHFSLLIVYATL